MLIALRFYATGGFLGSIAKEETFVCSKHAVSEALHETSLANIKNLAPRYLKFPMTDEERQQIKLGFYHIAGFPGCIGTSPCLSSLQNDKY